MKALLTLAVTTLLIGGLTACESPIAEDLQEPIVLDARQSYPLGDIVAAPGSPLSDKSNPGYAAAESQMFDDAYSLMMPVLSLLESDASLAEKQRAAREVMDADVRPEVHWAITTVLGRKMLIALLESPDADPSDVAFYTEALVKTDNPNADIVLAGLERSVSQFSEEEAARLSLRASQVGLAYARRPCRTCDAVPEANLTERGASILDASKRLDARAREVLSEQS